MFQEFIVCTLLYIVAVAIAYQPRHTAPATETDPETSIDYFPTVEEPPAPEPEVGSATGAPPKTTEAPIAVQPAPQPKPITEPLPKPAYVAKPKAIAVPTAPKPETAPPAQDLASLPIRELYALAKARKLPRYKRLNKAALVEALS